MRLSPSLPSPVKIGGMYNREDFGRPEGFVAVNESLVIFAPEDWLKRAINLLFDCFKLLFSHEDLSFDHLSSRKSITICRVIFSPIKAKNFALLEIVSSTMSIVQVERSLVPETSRRDVFPRNMSIRMLPPEGMFANAFSVFVHDQEKTRGLTFSCYYKRTSPLKKSTGHSICIMFASKVCLPMI